MNDPAPHELQMIQTALTGGPLGVDALAELLWYTHPDSGDSPANSWLEESDFVKKGFLASAEVLASWVFPALRAQVDREEAAALRWLTFIGAEVQACPPATGESGPSWRIHPKGYQLQNCVVKAADLRSAVLLLRARLLAAGLMVVIDTKDGSVASPWAVSAVDADRWASEYGKRAGEPNRFTVYPAHLGPGA